MPLKHNAALRHRIPRARCRITNWPAYEAGLKPRGDLTLWLDEAAVAGRSAPKRSTPGGQPVYSDLAIELVLSLRLVFHLALRQAEAFAGRCPRVLPSPGPIHLVLDSTGLGLFAKTNGMQPGTAGLDGTGGSCISPMTPLPASSPPTC